MFKRFIIILFSSLVLLNLCSNVGFSLNRESFDNITLDLKDVDILDVLKIFSMHSGLSIVAGQDVRARVTIFLKDVNAWDAFEVILAANNLAYKEKDGIIKVLTEKNYLKQYGKPFYEQTVTKTVGLKNARAEDVSNALNQIRSELGKVVVDVRSNTVIIQDTPEMVEKMEKVIESIEVSPETKVFTLKYADVEEMVEKMKEQLTEDIGSVEVDKRTGKIVVTDIPPKIEQITKMLESFDEKSREVLIEAKIVEVTLDREHRLGISWETIFKEFDNVGINVQSGNLVYYTDLPVGGFKLIMDAFKNMGEIRVISQPKILALNHKEATIKIAERQPYVTTTVSAVGETTQIGESITFMDIGTQLSVTPTINPDGYITMEVKPKISSAPSIYSYQSAYGGVEREIPIERTSEAETTVMLRDGRTMVIGGLMRERTAETEKKVPFIGGIPFLGRLFTHRAKEAQNTELAIFLTPHIVTGDESMEVAKLEKEGKISPPVPEKKPTFSWLKKGEKSAYTDYYLSLSSLLSRYISENYLPSQTGGRVNLILKLNSEGKLVGEPKVTHASSNQLAQIAKKLIVDASPFHPFPEELQKREEDFRISVNLPSAEGKPAALPEEETSEFSAEDMAFSEYYLTLSELISNYMLRNYPSTQGGMVEVEFMLTRDGKLVGRPEIMGKINPQLRELTIRAMRELSPFPPFPEKLKGPKKTFRVLITIPARKTSRHISKSYNLSKASDKEISLQEAKLRKKETSYSDNSEIQNGLDEFTYAEYRKYLSRKISQFIDASFGINGEVKVEFILDNNGKLIGEPKVINNPDRKLSQAAIQAVMDAAPFPKLPESISKEQAIFEISIVYR